MKTKVKSQPEIKPQTPDIAVIQSGGKQYKVKPDQVLLVEKLDLRPKAKVSFDNLLFKGEVQAEVLENLKLPKVKILKFKSKTRYKRVKGHRQSITKIKILKITKK